MSRTRRHAAAVLLALGLSFFVGMVVHTGTQSVPGYAGIAKESMDDQRYYLTRAEEVLDGHPFLSNPYLAEHKEEAPLQVWLPDYLLATPLGFLGLSVQQGYIAYDFIFPAILFLLTYAILFVLTRSRFVAIGFATVLHGGLFLLTLIRVPSPGFNFIWFELLFLTLILYIRSARRSAAVLATLSLGLLFYLYPYFWTYWVATLGIFLLVGFCARKEVRVWGVFGILIGGLALGAQYFWTTLTASHLPYYKETLERVGMIYTHFPSGYSIVVAATLTLVALAYMRSRQLLRFDGITLLLVSGTLAAIVVVNQQVITGQNLEFSSHYILPSIYWCVITAAYITNRLLETYGSQRPEYRRAACIGLGILALVSVGWGSAAVIRIEYASTSNDRAIEQYAPIFSWLRTHTPKDAVVFANDTMSNAIPAYTSNNVYDSSYAILFFLSNQEAEQRFIISHYWSTFTPAFVVDHQRSIFGAQYIDTYGHNQSKNTFRKILHLPLVTYEQIPTGEIDRIIAEAKALQAQPFEKVLKEYRVDYVVWDTNSDPEWKLTRYPLLIEQYRANGMAVYEVK